MDRSVSEGMGDVHSQETLARSETQVKASTGGSREGGIGRPPWTSLLFLLLLIVIIITIIIIILIMIMIIDILSH